MRDRTARRRGALAGFAVATLVLGCGSMQPVLYPNETYRAVGEAGAQRDLAECRALARRHGAEGSSRAGRVARSTAREAAIGGAGGAAAGAAAGAISGGAGRGAAVGAAAGAAWSGVRALLGGLLGPSGRGGATERAFVERCLEERGYDVVGWE